MNTTASAV